MPPPQGTINPTEGPGDYTVTKTVHSDTYPAIDPTKQDLFGQSVFISGASRGIGRSIAVSFAKAGVSTIILGARSSLDATEIAVKEAARKVGRPVPRILKIKLEVACSKSVRDAAAEVEREVERLDILVNNAGLFRMDLIKDSDHDGWWHIWEVNVKGLYLITRAFLPLMIKDESSAKQVLTVASVGAHLTIPSLSAYQPSKLAVVRLTDFIDKEYGPQGITAISVHPGNVLTEMAADAGVPEELKYILTETPELPGDTIVWLTWNSWSKKRRRSSKVIS